MARTCGACCRAGARVAAGAPLRARDCRDFVQDIPKLNPTITRVLRIILSRNYDVQGYNPNWREIAVRLDLEDWANESGYNKSEPSYVRAAANMLDYCDDGDDVERFGRARPDD